MRPSRAIAFGWSIHPHPAHTDLGSDLIRTEAGAGRQGHLCVWLDYTWTLAREARFVDGDANPIGDNHVVTLDRAADRRGRLSVRRYASAAEADRHDLEFWMQIPESERVLQVWRLSLEQWQLAGHPPYEPRLHRSVASVRRR